MNKTKTAEFPLVTFCLFSYNQEKYIQEAVKGALAQTYSPLEIIISDDCSTDSTYTIIQKVVGEYTGPHSVVLNRNDQNLGIAAHVNHVFSLAHGELFIVAAGDDISFPCRTEILVKCWLPNRETVFAIASSAICIDESGCQCGRLMFNRYGIDLRNKLDVLTDNHWFGCAAAISAKLYYHFSNLNFCSAEDRPYFRRACLLGSVFRIWIPLLFYRTGGVSSNRIELGFRQKNKTFFSMSFAGRKQFISDLKKVSLGSQMGDIKGWGMKCYKMDFLKTRLVGGGFCQRVTAWLGLFFYISFKNWIANIVYLFPSCFDSFTVFLGRNLWSEKIG